MTQVHIRRLGSVLARSTAEAFVRSYTFRSQSFYFSSRPCLGVALSPNADPDHLSAWAQTSEACIVLRVVLRIVLRLWFVSRHASHSARALSGTRLFIVS